MTAKIIKSFRIHPDQIKRLERWAEKHSLDVSKAVEQLLDKGMGYKPPKPKAERMPKVPRPKPSAEPTLGQIVKQRIAAERAAKAVDLSNVPVGPQPSPPGSRLKQAPAPKPKAKSKWNV